MADITARACEGEVDDRGVIGHARSTDLLHWEIEPPLSKPGSGFGDLEVPQIKVIDGKPVLLFSCITREMAGWKQSSAPSKERSVEEFGRYRRITCLDLLTYLTPS